MSGHIPILVMSAATLCKLCKLKHETESYIYIVIHGLHLLFSQIYITIGIFILP